LPLPDRSAGVEGIVDGVRALDFSSWQAIVSTLLGIIVVSLVAVGIRLAVMNGVQQRHARQNRQINERLKTLIAAYKALGGSFTGDLAVDPRHLRDLRAAAVPPVDAALDQPPAVEDSSSPAESGAPPDTPGAERRRRVRDAVEAALSDVILLGTEEQVRLAARAANEMVAGRSVEIAELVVSLRTFIREVLDLEAIPAEVTIPRQGPLRAGAAGGRGGRVGGSGGGGAAGERAGGGRGGGGGGAGGIGAMAGGGLGGAALHHGDTLDGDEGQPSPPGR